MRFLGSITSLCILYTYTRIPRFNLNVNYVRRVSCTAARKVDRQNKSMYYSRKSFKNSISDIYRSFVYQSKRIIIHTRARSAEQLYLSWLLILPRKFGVYRTRARGGLNSWRMCPRGARGKVDARRRQIVTTTTTSATSLSGRRKFGYTI